MTLQADDVAKMVDAAVQVRVDEMSSRCLPTQTNGISAERRCLSLTDFSDRSPPSLPSSVRLYYVFVVLMYAVTEQHGLGISWLFSKV